MRVEANRSGGDSRLRLLGLIDIVQIRAVNPRTRQILATLLPIILPIANSGVPSIAARSDTASSGIDVPKAMTVEPTKKRLIFRK